MHDSINLEDICILAKFHSMDMIHADTRIRGVVWFLVWSRVSTVLYLTDGQTDIQTYRRTDRYTDRQTDRRTYRHTDR